MPKDKTGLDPPLLVVKATFDDGKKNEETVRALDGRARTRTPAGPTSPGRRSWTPPKWTGS